MTRRKIQLVGGSSYYVSLPKEWADTQGVEPGDEVAVHTHLDGVLVVEIRETEGKPGVPDRAVLSVDEHDADGIERLLTAAYTAGVEQIAFESTAELSAAHHRAVDSVASELTGVTVSGTGDGVVTANTLLDPAEVSIRQSVRHLSFVALSMHRDATTALIGDTSPESVLERRKQVRRLHALVDRHFCRSLSEFDEVDALGITREELFRLWRTSQELEGVAEAAATVAKTARTLDTPVEESLVADVRETAVTARDCVERGATAVLEERDLGSVHESFTDHERVGEIVDDLEDRLFVEAVGDPRLIRATDAIERTSKCGTAIANVGLRKNICTCNSTSVANVSDDSPQNIRQASTGDE